MYADGPTDRRTVRRILIGMRGIITARAREERERERETERERKRERERERGRERERETPMVFVPDR